MFFAKFYFGLTLPLLKFPKTFQDYRNIPFNRLADRCVKQICGPIPFDVAIKQKCELLMHIFSLCDDPPQFGI